MESTKEREKIYEGTSSSLVSIVIKNKIKQHKDYLKTYILEFFYLYLEEK